MEAEEYWEQLHTTDLHESRMLSTSVSDHAVESEKLIPSNSMVLEVGCGTGFDSKHFGLQGHRVVALDVSQAVIGYCQETHCDISEVSFRQHDLKEPFDFKGSLFDLVYARLSLHYFTGSATRKIFKEIARVLKSKGLFVFVCKSVDDSLYGHGDLIEKDMYSNNGYVRHFFSSEYCEQLCEQDFRIKSLMSATGKLYEKPSAYLHCIAEKI